jgi:hypothetical protein
LHATSKGIALVLRMLVKLIDRNLQFLFLSMSKLSGESSAIRKLESLFNCYH